MTFDVLRLSQQGRAQMTKWATGKGLRFLSCTKGPFYPVLGQPGFLSARRPLMFGNTKQQK